MNIIIADDDLVTMMSLAGMLESQGHSVVTVENGLKASQLIRENQFQVVIADWMMPGMDGPDLCRFIRTLGAEHYIYVMLLTGKTQAQDRVVGLDAGADDFLTKPFDRAELLARLGVAKRIVTMEQELRLAKEKIEKARADDIKLGGHIQRALLVAQPPKEQTTFAIAVMNIPSTDIDGDFYDFFNHEVEVLDVFVGDAMGKGVQAALVGAGAKSHLIRGFSKLLDVRQRNALPDPAAIVQYAHESIANEYVVIESFVTLCYLRLDAIDGKATFVDCGHTKTIHWRKSSREVYLLEGDNLPIGFSTEEKYRQFEVPVGPGDIFCLYSDGVTEATSASGEMFGVQRVMDIVESSADDAPMDVVFRLREAIRSHTGLSEMLDDYTCVVVQVGTVIKPWGRMDTAFGNSLDNLASIRKFVEDMGHDCRLDQKAIDELQIAAHEATTNAILHGPEDGEDNKLRYFAERIDGGMRLTLAYHGDPFQPGEIPDIEVDISMDGGLGLFIIKRLLNDVRYYREGQENRVEMTKLAYA